MKCSENKNTCEFIDNPFPECYCKNITSLKIYNILQLCFGESSNCPIYQQNADLIE